MRLITAENMSKQIVQIIRGRESWGEESFCDNSVQCKLEMFDEASWEHFQKHIERFIGENAFIVMK